MFKHIAALGIAFTTLVAAPLALAAPCDPAHPSAARGAAPKRAAIQPRSNDSQQVALRRADSNRDGKLTFAEARAHGRSQFNRADRNEDGALSSWELRNASAELTRVSRGRDSVLTRAEYDAATRARFSRFDSNQDGLLSRRELGLSTPRTRSVQQARRWST